jgi:hypothetical protein
MNASSDKGPAKNRDNPAKSTGGKKTEATKSDGSSSRTAGGKKTSTS